MIEVKQSGGLTIITIKKGCSCSTRTFTLSEKEFQELKDKINLLSQQENKQ